MTLGEFFAAYADARPLFDAVAAAIETLGSAEVRMTKSQIAFRRSAFAWMHHLELRSPDEVDAEVRAWLREAWESAA